MKSAIELLSKVSESLIGNVGGRDEVPVKLSIAKTLTPGEFDALGISVLNAISPMEITEAWLGAAEKNRPATRHKLRVIPNVILSRGICGFAVKVIDLLVSE